MTRRLLWLVAIAVVAFIAARAGAMSTQPDPSATQGGGVPYHSGSGPVQGRDAPPQYGNPPQYNPPSYTAPSQYNPPPYNPSNYAATAQARELERQREELERQIKRQCESQQQMKRELVLQL